MAEDTSILRIMTKHHSILTQLISELDGTWARFDSFKWELEKHLFIEEKAVFMYWNSADLESHAVVPNLIKEHSKILDLLGGIETAVKSGMDVNLSPLKEFLIKHKRYEEDVFYPKLDKELDEEVKQMIRERIGKMVY